MFELMRKAFDHLVNAFKTLDAPHHEIHEGHTFEASYKTPDANPISDNATLSFLIRSSKRYLHFTFEPSCGGEAEIEFIVGCTYTGGSAVAVTNMNHGNSDFITSVSILTGVTPSGGSRIYNVMMPGGATNQTRSGGTARAGTERVLAPNTNYLLRITNRSGNNQHASIACQWYEEETNEA